MRYIIIAALVGFALWWFFGRPTPRSPRAVEEDFQLAKNKWATGTWTRADAAKYLDKLHQDALKGSKEHPNDEMKKEASALANEIVQWTLANVRKQGLK
jgi:hypothetical protein